tara:strand:- start:990 stop:1691 length:702 start_codon:yes stop_codon:yes gene_type:complete
MTYGLEVDGNVNQVQINSTSGNACLVTYENFSLNAGQRTVGSKSPTALDAQDILFARPTTTTGTSQLYNRWGASTGGQANTQYASTKYQIVPSVAANFVRTRGSGAVSGISDGTNYGLQVFDSSGNAILDTRNTSGIFDIIDVAPAGISHGSTLFTIPTSNRSSYFVSMYNTYYEHFTFFGGTQYEIVIGGLSFEYGSNKVTAIGGLRQYGTSSWSSQFSTMSPVLLGKLKGT